MKFMMMKMTMITSMINLMLKNPMSMGISLLIQTTMIIMLMNKSTNSSWFPMITFLMMMGGLLILFTYMSSIASNEKFKMKINMTLTMMIFILTMDNMMIEFQMNEKQEIMKTSMEMSMMKMYNKKSMMITLMMGSYLLITMISSSMLVKHNKGPLRQKM